MSIHCNLNILWILHQMQAWSDVAPFIPRIIKRNWKKYNNRWHFVLDFLRIYAKTNMYLCKENRHMTGRLLVIISEMNNWQAFSTPPLKTCFTIKWLLEWNYSIRKYLHSPKI